MLNFLRNSCASHRCSLRYETRKYEVSPHGNSGKYQVAFLPVNSPHSNVFVTRSAGIYAVYLHRDYVDSDGQM